MSHGRRVLYAIALAVTAALGAAHPLRAQDEKPVIVRGVIDSVRPMPNAVVTFSRIDPPDALRQLTVTDSAGGYAVALFPGRYRYDAQAARLPSVTGEITVSPDSASGLEMVATSSASPSPGMPASKNFNLFDVNYFALGFEGREDGRPPFENANQVKFRVSLRYKLVNLSRCDSCRSGIYAAYTQNSFWHLYDDSGPFFDNNYSPGLLVYKAIDEGSEPNYRGVTVYVGAFHESNGLKGESSRGWNRVVAGASLGTVHHTRFSGALSLWHPWGMEATNADLVDYAGRGELMMYFQPYARGGDGGWLALQVRSRLFGSRAVNNVEVNAIVDLPGPVGRYFASSGFVQLFSGYAENLLTYNERRTVLRAGIALLR